MNTVSPALVSCAPPPLQIEFRDMRVSLLATLMSAHDEAGAVSAEYALTTPLANMISKNYDLFAGVDGVPAAQSQDAFTVRLCVDAWEGAPQAARRWMLSSVLVVWAGPRGRGGPVGLPWHIVGLILRGTVTMCVPYPPARHHAGQCVPRDL